MDDMTAGRWRYTQAYLAEVFGVEDEAARGIRLGSERAGLDPIAVRADAARLLTLLARTTAARTAVEVGTLGGYSAWHILRGLGPDGRLITIERDPRAAEVARENLAHAGIADRVRVEVGRALDVLPRVAAELGARSVGLVFLDADKSEYAAYWGHLRPLLAEGGLLVADNVLGTGRWWIDDEAYPGRVAIDAFNRAITADPELEVAGLLVGQGVLVARRRRAGER